VNPALYEQLVRHEGREELPYNDATGEVVKLPKGEHITVGVGHNLSNKMSKELQDLILDYDSKVALRELISIFPELPRIGERRANALTNMMFQLGKPKFLTFKKMIPLIHTAILTNNPDDWFKVSEEAKDSDWYRKYPIRASEVVTMLR
jgi:hypothetical protein